MSYDQILDSSSEASEAFKHDPLHDNSKAIRVIQIEHGHHKSQLRCSLKHIDLDGSVKYSCLSYMWGAPVAEHTILINGRTFQVRQSLMEFLYRARKLQIRKSLLWIDAICINQDDHEERIAQVRIMSQIYKSAETVIIYPGPCPNPITFKMVLKLYRLVHSFHMKYYEVEIVNTIGAYCRQTKLYRRLIDTPMESFMTLAYWNRMWIVQEVILNGNAQVLCHDTLISKFHFSDLPKPNYSDIAWWKLCHNLEQRKDDLYGQLTKFGERQCQLVNDRLYALLGMCIDVPPDFPIDYNRSAATVVLDCFQYFPLNQISDEFYTYYICARDYEYKMSLPLRVLGAYPYILCYTCFTGGTPETSEDVLRIKDSHGVSSRCLCPGYPLQYVFSLRPPKEDPQEAKSDKPKIRTLDEKVKLGYCEGCNVDLHACPLVANMKTKRLNDAALLFEFEHPNQDVLEAMLNKPRYRHQPRTTAAA